MNKLFSVSNIYSATFVFSSSYWPILILEVGGGGGGGEERGGPHRESMDGIRSLRKEQKRKCTEHK